MDPQTANLAIDFDRDIREAVLQALPHDPARTAELQAMSFSDLLVTYINWRNRLISPRCREICMSSEFQRTRYGSIQRTPALEHIIEALKTGGDVTPHLSTRVTAGFDVSASAKLNQRQDLDLLLNDWNVHHLHLSTTMQPNGFVKRTGPLLFAVVGSTKALLIDILDHKSWSREHIAHVIINNWPNANFVHHLPNVVWGLAISEAECQQLRNAGIHSGFIEHKDKYYLIGMGGLSSAGTSIQHTKAHGRHPPWSSRIRAPREGAPGLHQRDAAVEQQSGAREPRCTLHHP
jgi:hypothetical protein